jgi:hypothetical protein
MRRGTRFLMTHLSYLSFRCGPARRGAMAGTLLLNLLSCVFLTTFATAQCASESKSAQVERFSAVQHIDRLPGSSGIELILEEKGLHVKGVLRDYEGAPDPLVTRLRGILRGCDVALKGKNARGNVEIHGTIAIASFQCTITRRIGTNVYSERVSLRREPPESDHVGSHVLMYQRSLTRFSDLLSS